MTGGDVLTRIPRCEGILLEILAERWRQIALRDEKRFARTAADPGMGDASRLAVLIEEVMEVLKALQADDDANLRTELVQVAAVCVAWCEYIDAHRRAPTAASGPAEGRRDVAGGRRRSP